MSEEEIKYPKVLIEKYGDKLPDEIQKAKHRTMIEIAKIELKAKSRQSKEINSATLNSVFDKSLDKIASTSPRLDKK